MMRFKIILESKMEKCYSIDRRGATAHKVVDLLIKVEIPPCYGQVLGWFFYVKLMTYQINECQQC
ncbi:hypothetical protein CLOSTHATH_01774 [Hungatella hathewayi DSM 13479]|uniref:Uncharacterized protein n=1 Tax=Hungatella hathewayi DSM 13479 TaxID=566550 RepID=D3ADU5_9FIRM|nr:hypothetical protein CLOSTHATH_01774 [Hungatella hathewayi DSM 13479]